MRSKYIIVFFIFAFFAGILLGVQYPATARAVEFPATAQEHLQFTPRPTPALVSITAGGNGRDELGMIVIDCA